MNPSRLWASQGKTSDAHAVLSGVFAWFTEGPTPPIFEAQR